MSAAALLTMPAAPGSAATHRVQLPPDVVALWVATKGGASECRGYNTPQAMAGCPRFRPVSSTGKVDLAGKLVCIVRFANAQYHRAEYFVDPVYDVLPNGHPIKIPLGR